MVRRISARDTAPRRARPLGIASALILATFTIACSGQGKSASVADSTTTVASAGSLAASSAPTSMTGTVHLEVGSGPHAGTYNAKMTEGGCSYGLAGPTAWGNQYSIDAKDPKAFSSLQLIVPDTKAAASGTSVFQLTAGFGPLFGSGASSYTVNTLPNANSKSGSGKVTVADHGSTGSVTFDVKTAEGIALKGTIDCATVLRGS